MTPLFCPVCCSPNEVAAEGHVEITCRVCGTPYTVEVDPKVVEAHSVV